MGALFKAAGALIVAAVIVVGVSLLGNALVPPRDIPVPRLELASSDKKSAAPQKPLAQLLAEANVDKGKATFKQCLACHTVGEGQVAKIGPNLFDVVGREKAIAPGFVYSENMKAKGGSWTYEDLDVFLTSPKAFVANTKMAFVGLKKPEDRANVIAYLHSLNPKSPPLPTFEAPPPAPAETPAAPSAEPQKATP